MKLSKSGLKAVKQFLLALLGTLLVIGLLTIATVYLPMVWVLFGWITLGTIAGVIYMYNSNK